MAGIASVVPELAMHEVIDRMRCVTCGRPYSSVRLQTASRDDPGPEGQWVTLVGPAGRVGIRQLRKLHTLTRNQAAIHELARAFRNTTGNLPSFPGISPDD